jgi:hypothetical protein
MPQRSAPKPPTPSISATVAKTAADRMIDAAANPGESNTVERRGRKRVPYYGTVALVLVAPTGARSAPMVLQARDISHSGIGVVSRQMIYPGSRGAMQLVRSDGSIALVGVIVTSCRYVGSMRHHTGLMFAPLPPGIGPHEFLDRSGRMRLLDANLKANIGRK